MAETITYADLRFVKAPLKKSISNRLGQEADEDEELTYENVQVSPVPGGSSSLAASGLGGKAGVQSERPPAAWSSVRPPAAGRLPRGCAACLQYLLLGLLLTSLLLGVAAICLGVRYVQVSWQLQQTNSFLEATNSSLRQQLHLKMTQLGQREEDLQGSRRELAQSQEALQKEQRVCQETGERLQACQSDREKTKEALQREEVQRKILEQRLNSMQDTLKPLFTCLPSDTCCPLGWILNEKSCFYISLAEKNWKDSRNYCKSLSSDLATFSDIYSFYPPHASSVNNVLAQVGQLDSFWVGLSFNDGWQWTNGKRVSGRTYGERSKCVKMKNSSWVKLQPEECTSPLPCLCEMAAFMFPVGDQSSH
ncbi:B-cell differentiation antigen CD72 isoform X1 [Manis pentadactyla]|uniref:B-cell differentiation antigen CD72 isoform X1 n=1 Tax=Manis pentadactyla TaxID=143292 RepID=UPI0018769EC0|nr:B-cell differentiation antigen CD72 isoform X1 [Manis pentadactyla]